MIKIAKVEAGYPSYGPSQGAKTLFITFEPCEGNLPEGTAQLTPEQIYAQEMVDNLINMLDKQGLVEMWTKECLMGITHIMSIGDEIAAPDNIGVMNEFYYLVGKLAVAMQKDTGLQKMRPPYLCYHGTPKYYTGRKTFYENFNVLAINYPVDVTEEDFQERVKPLAAVEMNNHLFSQAYFIVKNEDDFNKINLYADNQMLELIPIRVFIYDVSTDTETKNKIRKACFEKNYRYFEAAPDKSFVSAVSLS